MEVTAQEQTNESIPVAWQHDKALGDCMIELYENKLWTDVKFRCSNHDEHERIYAHKIVLAARSPVFQAMFFGACAEANEDITLDNIEAATFNLFLKFLYQDKVTLTEDIAASVLETAHYYQVTNLVLYCADFLAGCITSRNVCDMLSLARCYDVISLCRTCCRFIDDHADEVIESEGFLNLEEDTLAYVVKGDTFYADEVKIFEKAEEWASKKLEERKLDKHGQNVRKVLGTCFFYLRLPTMTSERFFTSTRRKGYYSVEEYEDIAGFINKTPDTTVTSNSCIRRLPTEEHISFISEDEDTELLDKIETSFTLSTSRDLKIKSITLSKVHPRLKYVNAGFGYMMSCCKSKLERTIPELNCDIEAVMRGSLQVTCHNDKKNPEAGAILDKNDENEEIVSFTFKKDLMLVSSDKIDLEETLILDKKGSPYTFTVNLEFGGAKSFNMKTTVYEYISFPLRSENGVVTVENIEGDFAAIESICFENLSNRE